MKILMYLVLLPFSVSATVTWVNSNVSLTAITPGGVQVESNEFMTLESRNIMQEYQTYCSTSRTETESDASKGTTRTTIGDYSWFSYATKIPGGDTLANSRIAGILKGEGINRNNHTMYCVIHPTGVAASAKDIRVTGLIITADLATVPMPTIEFPKSQIDLGTCTAGQTLKEDVASLISYQGYGVAQTSTVAWEITSAATNPNDSVPTVTVNGSKISPVKVPLREGPVDPGISLSYLCNTPGEYSWNMIFTYMII